MALSDKEKQMILGHLDSLDDVKKAIVIASLKAFAQWLADTLYSIYCKIKDSLSKFWNWLRS
jgi:hypothetical protein